MRPDFLAERSEHRFAEDRHRAFAGRSPDVDKVEAAVWIAQVGHQPAGALQAAEKLHLALVGVNKRFGGPGDQPLDAFQGLIEL